MVVMGRQDGLIVRATKVLRDAYMELLPSTPLFSIRREKTALNWSRIQFEMFQTDTFANGYQSLSNAQGNLDVLYFEYPEPLP